MDVEQRELTREESDELLELLKTKNNLEFNILKVIEEIAELNVELVKYLSKSEELRPSKEAIIEELGDFYFRSAIVMEQLDIVEQVATRMDSKAAHIYDHLKSTNGTKVIIER